MDSWQMCACRGLGPMWLNGIAYWEGNPGSQIKSNQIKSFSLQSPRSTVHGPPFSIATGG